MNAERFQSAVKNRANERVQGKIKAFEAALKSAITTLWPDLCGIQEPWNSPKGKILLESLTAPRDPQKWTRLWPHFLWKREEELVTKEIFAIMDEAQRALMASPPKDSNCNIPDEGNEEKEGAA